MPTEAANSVVVLYELQCLCPSLTIVPMLLHCNNVTSKMKYDYHYSFFYETLLFLIH